MWKLLAGLCCLALVAFVVLGALTFYLSNSRFRRLSRQQVPTVCISCQGKGWITEQQRSLEFDGTGFIDAATTNRPCPTCAGTGVIHR